jgi:RNA polymerase sigma-70 factor (ECF subfamily)
LLVASARAGDLEAREQIVRAYQEMVYNLSLRLTRDPELASVAFQETFLKVFASLGRFRQGSRLKTWIYRIATNEALQLLRRRKARTYLDLDDLEADPRSDLSSTAATLGGNPHRLLEDRELRRRLESAIEELPPKHRAAFVLVDMEGLSAKEAADATGVKVNALKTDLRRARLFLRDRLADYLEDRNRG